MQSIDLEFDIKYGTIFKIDTVRIDKNISDDDGILVIKSDGYLWNISHDYSGKDRDDVINRRLNFTGELLGESWIENVEVEITLTFDNGSLLHYKVS